MTLGLVHVEKIGDAYVPVCRLCDFVGRPRRYSSEAQYVLGSHQTCKRHRRALCRVAVAGRATEAAT